jgi:broad specificity phosphatase PhoE/ribonuclease HI
VSRPRRLKVIVEADGGARGNPGPAGYGTVVREASTGEILVEKAEPIGVATNNVAEYSGLVSGLQAAADLGAVEVEARLDSKLVVEQMSGRWQIKQPALRTLAARAATLAQRFDTVRYTWVPRERNKHADALANAAMDGKVVPEADSDRPAQSSSVDVDVDVGSVPDRDRPRSWMPPTGLATRLVLVRHGQTELNAQRRYSGRADVALSETGRLQARKTAARLTAMAGQVAAIITSPLSRCTETADEFAATLGDGPVLVEPDLTECDFGEWEGLTFAEVRERWPERLDEWLASPSVAPPGGESFEAVTARVRPVVSTLLEDYPGKTIIVVSHVTPIKLILRDALAAGDAFLHRLFLDPAGISVVDTWPDDGVAVRTVNDTAHLA